MGVSRAQVIQVLRGRLAEDPVVFAMWLEGADSPGSHPDEFSDLDVVVDVADGHEAAVQARAEAALATLGPLDLRVDFPVANAKLRHRVLHVAGSSEFLLVDFVVQSHSRAYRFIRQDTRNQPRVLFDKAGVIGFTDINRDTLARELDARVVELCGLFTQQARVRKYLARGRFLEALAYYRRYVLDPLIELLRIVHTPLLHDHHLVHASDDLPPRELRELEDLHRVAELSDIPDRLARATVLFERTLATRTPGGLPERLG
jgi:hypothetical protein